MGSVNAYSISRRNLDGVVKRAVTTARRGGREICGLLVAHANALTPIQLRNKVKRGGSWAFYALDVRRAVQMAQHSGGEVVGTFHSHPTPAALGPRPRQSSWRRLARRLAEPGPSDIEHALNNSLMLIVECLGKKWALWRIDAGKAKRIRLVRRRP